jgi:hypothetical protein
MFGAVMCPAHSPSQRHLVAVHAALKRHRSKGDPELIEAERDLAGAQILDYARKLVAKWPTLTPEQIDHVAKVLRNGGAPGGGDR